MYRGIHNADKHLKWSRKERLTKNNYDLELFPEHPFDRDVNPVKLSKYATGYEYVWVPSMQGFIM